MTDVAHEHDRLIERIALSRDRDAFAALFAHFAPRLKAWLIKAGAAPAAAEDFAQDAMLAVWRKADLFDARRAHAATWIFTIARNLRIDAARRDARQPPAPAIELAPEPLATPEEAIRRADDAAHVTEALAVLSDDQREVIRLAFFQDRPHSEIAALLQLPLGTVKSRIRKAMIRLRRELDQCAPDGFDPRDRP